MSDEELADWKRAVADSPHGKVVGDALYVHSEATTDALESIVTTAAALAGIDEDDFNIVKFRRRERTVSLLDYPDFDSEAFPALARSWLVRLDSGEVKKRAYDPSSNRPILHRKELFVPEDDPLHDEFARLTREAERLGLFDAKGSIGFAWQWEEILEQHGVTTDGNRIVARPAALPIRRVARHRTAMARNSLSSPMQALWRHQYLDGSHTVFDYGCGRGDDLAALEASGIPSGGWDPYFRPDSDKVKSDVVNIGFVINVIEDPEERADALRGAWSLTRKVLSVAALIGGRSAYARFRLLGDGVVTSRGTFQKYFSHGELGEYIQDVLGREPVSVAPGVYFVFRSDEEEQAFFERKQRSRRLQAMPSVLRAQRGETARKTSARKPDKWIQNAELLDDFWMTCLELARVPHATEFARFDELKKKLGSPKRVINHLLSTRDASALEEAQSRRYEDLLVFLAVNLFSRRKSFRSLSDTLQKDIKTHFGAYSHALEDAKKLLFSIADTDAIEEACTRAAESGVGFILEGEALQLESEAVNELPPLLRVYVGAAEQLVGEAASADLVKIHIFSGKLSLMSYDDFYGSRIPMLYERVKIDMPRQRVDYFDYGDDYEPQPLYLKSRFMLASSEGYEEQKAYDDWLEGLDIFDFDGYGPSRSDFDEVLEARGFRYDGIQPSS